MECPLGKPLGFAAKRGKRKFGGLQPTVAMDKLLNKLICLMVLKLIKYINIKSSMQISTMESTCLRRSE